MINVTVYYKPSEQVKGYVIQGHAGMAEAGYDLVCASVSAIAQTALLGLDKHLNGRCEWRIEDDGFLECWLPDGIGKEESIFAQVIIETMVLGLKSIEKEYGQYLAVTKRRWNKCCLE